jgi:hypothetical protein
MEQSTAIAATGSTESLNSGVSWAAVLAGAAASLALTLVLLSFGTGMGFAVVSPWGGPRVSSTTFEIGTGLFFIVMAMISSALGGYLAGRLRSKWVGLHTDEIAFRDTAHGFLAWAVASVIGAVLLATPATFLTGGALSGATQGAANSAQNSPMNNYADMLLRSDNRTDQQPLGDTRGEVVRLLTNDFRQGNDVNSADHDYLVKVVASRTGLNQPDAEKRVNDVIAQAKDGLEKTRKAAMHTAIWLTLSLFVGALCAALAAWEGGGTRDGTWGRAPLRQTAPRHV